MFSKIMFALATVCVVNASVITVNVFDDDPETEGASKPKDCNNQACDQLCRRLKFPGGTCVNGRCKCDNFLNAEDEFSVETLLDLEDSVLQTDDFKADVAANPSRCNLKVCSLLCHRLNKTSGACVDGRCKCNNSLIAEDDMTDPAEFRSPGSCDLKACAQQCFKLGFPGGACINGRCKCDDFLNTEDAVTESNVEDSVSSRACNNKICNQLCRKKNFRGGACIGANCYCNKFLTQLEDIMADPSESLPQSSCNSIACDDQCRRTGWHGDVCINGQCKCDYFLNTEVVESTLANLQDSVLPRRCTYQACNELCRRLKFPGGTCVNNRCKCDNFFRTEDAVDEYSELATRRICNIRQCNLTCTRRGYDTARCVNGWCKCHNKIERQDSPLLNEVTSDVNEESNVMIRTNEEELVVPLPSA